MKKKFKRRKTKVFKNAPEHRPVRVMVNMSSHPREAEACRDLNLSKNFRNRELKQRAQLQAHRDEDGAWRAPNVGFNYRPPLEHLQGQPRKMLPFFAI